MIRFLQQNNRFTKGLFVAIIAAAVVTMVITLVPGIFDNAVGSDPNIFATVHSPGFFGRFTGSSEVKTDEVNLLAQRQMAQQRFPDFYLPFMVQRAGQVLVQGAILKREADRLGLQVSDDDLRRELQTGRFAQYLYPNGQFIGQDQYINFVQTAFQISLPEFESQLKQDLELQRLQALITDGVTVSDNSVRDAYKEQGTKVKFDYAVISADDIAKTINPSDADLRKFFDDNKVRYAVAAPETRKIQYVTFDASNLPGGKPQLTDAEVQSYYDQHKEQYQVKDQAKVRHILIAVPAGADAKTDAAAKAKAEDILKQIKAGGNFADLAGKNSDDPGSRVQGGELGWLNPGQTVPEFDKAAFSLKAGQTSDVIKTQFGYHILQVEEKKTAHLQPLAEVKAQIVPLLEQQKGGTAMQNLATQLAAESKKDGLDKVAAAHNLHAVTTDYVTKDGSIPGVADGSQILSQAFTVTKGAPPASASTGDGFALLQVVDVKPAHAPSFDEYKDHLQSDYREQQVPQILNAELAKLDDRAKVLNDLKKAAAEMKIPVKTSDMVGRDGQVPDIGALTGPAAVVFTLNKGAVSGPINLGRAGVVLSIVDKQEPAAQEIADNFAQTREQLLDAQRGQVFQVYVGDVMQKYENAKAVRYSQKQATPPVGN